MRNLGNSWILDYRSIASLTPLDRAAAGLSAFYQHVIDTAAEELRNATTRQAKEMAFSSKGLVLRLRSEQSIRWDWVMNLAAGMKESLSGRHTVLYEAVAENVYWDVAAVGVALSLL